MSKVIGEEYASSLADLTVNSKPLINMLTILAEENIDHASVIVESVGKHLEKVRPDIKLPVLYLVDSIIKNVGGAYTQLFSQIIVNMFCSTFKQVDEKTRSQMFKLRETWHDVFPALKLYQLDVKVNLVDPAWPIQAQPPQPASNIHLNPNFLKKGGTPANANQAAGTPGTNNEKMLSALALKEQELLHLRQRKIDMELAQTKIQIAEQAKRQQLAMQGIPPDMALMGVPGMGMVPAGMAGHPVMTNSMLPPHVNPAVMSAKNRLGPGIVPGPPIPPLAGGPIRRRDPRLARIQPAAAQQAPLRTHPDTNRPIANNVFDIQPREDKRERPARERAERRARVRPGRDKERERERDRERERERDKAREGPAAPERPPAPAPPLAPAPPPGVAANAAAASARLPPIPKIANRQPKREPPAADEEPAPTREAAPKSEGASPRRPLRARDGREGKRERKGRKGGRDSNSDPSPSPTPEPSRVAFKELKTSAKGRNYVRRNRARSESAERNEPRGASDAASIPSSTVPSIVASTVSPTVPSAVPPAPSIAPPPAEPVADSVPTAVTDVVVGNGLAAKDVDLRLLPKPVPITKKRPSTEHLDVTPVKKSRAEKFDALFGDEDVDLRKLPPMDPMETLSPPPPPNISNDNEEAMQVDMDIQKPEGDSWAEMKHPKAATTPDKSNLDIVRAKLAEATKGKDRLGRPLLYNKLPDDPTERKRTITMTSEDTDMRARPEAEAEADNLDGSIKIIMSQAEEQVQSGNIDRDQYNTLMVQILQLSEKRKLREAKQRDSLEASKRRLARLRGERPEPADWPEGASDEEPDAADVDERPARFGDIDERLPPPPARPHFLEDSDMRRAQYPHARYDDFGGARRGDRRGRGVNPRGRGHERRRFEERSSAPLAGFSLSACPLRPYESAGGRSPPRLGGSASRDIPPADGALLEYVARDTMKSIRIDEVAREIRFYEETAVVFLEWDDPREISFQPGERRVYLDGAPHRLAFGDGYSEVTVAGRAHRVRLGAPTRELFVDERWFECFFDGPPFLVELAGRAVAVKLEGPPPQVRIGSVRRTDLVAAKINLIVDAVHMVPVFLDAKPQIFRVAGAAFTLRFVDSLRTVLINEKPFKVEFGGLPKPVYVGKRKYFIRFSVLPRSIKPGFVNIKNMEGIKGTPPMADIPISDGSSNILPSVPEEIRPRPEFIAGMPSEPRKQQTVQEEHLPNEGSGRLDVLASVMPSSMAPESDFDTGYSLAAPFLPPSSGGGIPGLEPPPGAPPGLGGIDVTDLFAKLVATGIVRVGEEPPAPAAPPGPPGPPAEEPPPGDRAKAGKEERPKPARMNSRSELRHVNLMRSDTLKSRQPGMVSRLYGGMQCSGCGCRFPPEQTVRYSQHLDWHFRANRRDRMAARRARSRDWHYDLSDWIQYQEIEDLDEREKSWFESQGSEAEGAGEGEGPPEPSEPPSSVAASDAPEDLRCEVCRDTFRQFYNEDREEWQLARAVRHRGNNYHPLCLRDHEASLERQKEAEQADGEEVEKSEVELMDTDANAAEDDSKAEEETDDRDNESVVELISQDSQGDDDTADVEVVEILLEEDDDVVFKAEPVEEIIVEDDVDTDEETEKIRAARDKDAEDFNFALVKIKQEPVDPDDEPVVMAEEAVKPAQADNTHTALTASIDGNLQLESTNQSAPLAAGIRINIAKPIPAPQKEITEETLPKLSDLPSDEPAPPGEELEIEYKLKSGLEGVIFHKQRPVEKGAELSALCSIM